MIFTTAVTEPVQVCEGYRPALKPSAPVGVQPNAHCAIISKKPGWPQRKVLHLSKHMVLFGTFEIDCDCEGAVTENQISIERRREKTVPSLRL